MMNVMILPDQPDSAASAAGDAPTEPAAAQAFAILAREHHRGLLVFARALCRDESTAADLVQDAFLTAWRGLARFDTSRDFGAWMRGITRNKWREYCRKHQREVDVDDTTLARWEDQLAAHEQSRADGRGTVFDWLEDCLRHLPAAMAEVVERFYYQRQDGETAAAALGIDAAAMRKRLQRAREALRQCLDRKLHPAG